jgi:aminoglycoside 2''-phosphotransferase
MYGRIQAKLFPHMREEARQAVTRHFTDYFAHADAYAFEPRLRHGDFGTGNILYDPVTRSITGILDFGGATLGDPAVDFAGLLGYGEEFCRPCAQVYPGLEEMQERIRFYWGTFALEEALFGVENGDERAFASGIQQFI